MYETPNRSFWGHNRLITQKNRILSGNNQMTLITRLAKIGWYLAT